MALSKVVLLLPSCASPMQCGKTDYSFDACDEDQNMSEPEALCSVCQRIDFTQLCTRTDIPDGEIILVAKRERACPLCRFFFKLLEPSRVYMEADGWEVRAFTHLDYFGYRFGYVDAAQLKPFLGVLPKDGTIDSSPEYLLYGLIDFVPDDARESSRVRVVDSEVDYISIGRQLGYCIDQHPECTQIDSLPSDLLYIFLIDCKEGAMVRRPFAEEYITLSYVWGDQQRDAAQSTTGCRFDRDKCPLTIQDAIEVVLRLGKRYLWVDRYCIDPSDKEEQHLMLSHMDHIYEKALLTLVTLHGKSDEAGLPGVSVIPRSEQLIYKTLDGQLISTCSAVSEVIKDTKWNTRGWTYQEARLSRRCLFFSQRQVYFVCRRSAWSEAVPWDPASSILAGVLNSFKLEGKLFSKWRNSRTTLFDDLQAYTSRHLTYERDILFAFAGVLNRSPFAFHWGVPIRLKDSTHDPNRGFALGLMWQEGVLETRHTRRPGFPTWSWTSILGPVLQSGSGRYLYAAGFDTYNGQLSPYETDVRFWTLYDGRQVSLLDQPNKQRRSTKLEDSSCLIVEGSFIPIRFTNLHQLFGLVSYQLLGSSREFFPDITSNQARMLKSLAEGRQVEELVLILILWHDTSRSGKMQLVLMALDWIDDTHAQRVGLIDDRIIPLQFTVEEIRRMPPMVRKTITLL